MTVKRSAFRRGWTPGMFMISWMAMLMDTTLVLMLLCFATFHVRMVLLNETTIEGPSPVFDVGRRKNWEASCLPTPRARRPWPPCNLTSRPAGSGSPSRSLARSLSTGSCRSGAPARAPAPPPPSPRRAARPHRSVAALALGSACRRSGCATPLAPFAPPPHLHHLALRRSAPRRPQPSPHRRCGDGVHWPTADDGPGAAACQQSPGAGMAEPAPPDML